MAISRKLIGILAVSSIGLIALSASAQNANDDASRKTKPKNTSGYSWGVSQGNGYAGTQNQRKKENSTKTQEKGERHDDRGVTHTDDWRERNSKGYTAGGTWVSGDPVELNLRKKESGHNAQEKVQYQDFDFSQHSRQSAPSTLPAGSNEWQPPKPAIGVDQKLGQPDYRTAKARPKANSKSRSRN